MAFKMALGSAEERIARVEGIAKWFYVYKPEEIDPSGNATQFSAMLFAWGYLAQREGIDRDELDQLTTMRGYDYAAANSNEEIGTMNVKIKETGKIENLSIVDRKTGVNWVHDLIGNAGAFNDGQFVWSEEDDAFLADQSTYDWWSLYISDTLTTEEEVEALADELGIDADIIRERIEENTGSDYGNHRNQAIQAMNDIREELAQSLENIARAMYTEVYGAIDDKLFKAEKIGEMEDWLKEGDPDMSDLAALIVEWREYDADEIERRGV